MSTPTLSPSRTSLLERARAHWASRFGAGSLLALLGECAATLQQLTDETAVPSGLGALCERLERTHKTRYGSTALSAELADERERDAAMHSDAALIRYQQRWERKLARLQRAYPQRWHVPSWSDEEVRDALTLRLIEAVRTQPEVHIEYCRAGKEWGLLVMQQELAQLRRTFRLRTTLTDFSDAPLLQREANQEERWLEREADTCRALATQSAQQQLSQPQRRWFSALKFAANSGEFFQTSDQLNLSAASRLLGKHRSSAQRAYKELQVHFTRELERLD
jgi:hypothetical protein